MKRTYVKPTMDMEQFAANQYVAACFKCDTVSATGIGVAGYIGECTYTQHRKKNVTIQPCTEVHIYTDAEAKKLAVGHTCSYDWRTGVVSNVKTGYLSQTTGYAHLMFPDANASN